MLIWVFATRDKHNNIVQKINLGGVNRISLRKVAKLKSDMDLVDFCENDRELVQTRIDVFVWVT